MIKQTTIIFGFWAIGEIIAKLFSIHFPGSIIGMVLLTAALEKGIIQLKSVKSIADILVKNMGFFFIPAGVALMLYFDIIEHEIIPILLSMFISTFLVLLTTGWTHQLFRRHGNTKK